MGEDLSGDLPARAFDVKSPDRAVARQPRARRRPLARWVYGAALVATCLVCGLGFPILSGNWFCRNLVQRIDANEPYSMVITPLRGAAGATRWDVVVSSGNYAVRDHSGQIWLLGSEGSSYSVDAANKVCCYTGKGGKIDILQNSTAVVKQFSGWDLHRRVKRLGTTLDDGQSLDRYRLSTEAGSPEIEVDVDPSTGLPVTALIGRSGSDWDFQCRYSFDGEGSQNAFRAMGDSYTHLVNLTSPSNAAKALEGRNLLRADLGRDKMTIFEFAQMRSGAVFFAIHVFGLSRRADSEFFAPARPIGPRLAHGARRLGRDL